MSFTLSDARKLTLAGAAAIATLGAAASGAQAATKPLAYSGLYPLIGDAPTTIATSASLPETVKVGVPTRPVQVTTTFSGDWTVAALFNLTQSRSVDGTASLNFRITGPSYDRTITLPETVLTATTPAETDWPVPLVLKATGTAPSLSFTKKGRYTVSQVGVALNLLARDSCGGPIPIGSAQDGPSSDADLLNSFDVPFTLAPATQSTQIASFTVTG